jgi:hypothetical protein
MKARWALLGLALLLAGVGATTYEKRSVSKAFMRQKLIYSQGVMEGLTLEQFDLITKYGIKMRKMNLTNLFYVLESPGYMASLTNYQESIDRMLFAAAGKDLKSGTEAYQRIVESCVECHRTFRTAQRPKAQHP